MKKITKSMIAIMLVAIMCMTSVPVFAADNQSSINAELTPRLSHTIDSTFTFSATANRVSVPRHYFNIFVVWFLTGFWHGASWNFMIWGLYFAVLLMVEKRFLLVFWNDVDEWSASSTDAEDYFFHTFTLNGSGTYRATFTLKITGNNGTVDTIEQVIESKY